MISERQGNCDRVHGNFMFFLCRVAFLMIIALNPARGEDASRASQRTRSGSTTTYKLVAGWNLISINLNLDEVSKALLQGKGAIGLEAKSKAYAINGNLAATQACWIYCHEVEEITLSGSAPDDFGFEACLKPGWNFAGPLDDLSLAGGAVAWGWDGQNYRPTEDLLAKQGYWIYWSDGNIVLPKDAYLVVDLSAGSEATSYPFAYQSVPPEGGWTDEYKTTKLVLRKIPAGTFTMGSPEDEMGRGSYETAHPVTLTKDFYVGVFEVTQKQWNLVMGKWPSYFSNTACRDSRPVEQVSYNNIRGINAGSGWPANNAVDADSFMGRLRAKTNLDFDLPTDAQWEYACRARTTSSLNSGKNLTDEDACPNLAEVGRYWYNGGKDYSTDSDTSHGSAKVGSYLPNLWGLYDMHGNVLEWCLDWHLGDLGSSAQTDPRGDAGGYYRVIRGGSWYFPKITCRSANRGMDLPSRRRHDVGFRLALTVP
jgi:formylglycine-generating enzyme required for sulfatase activity